MKIDLKKLPVNVTGHIIKFKDLMVAAWPHIDLLMKEFDWHTERDPMGDWIISSWEIFVEGELLEEQGYLTSLSIHPNVRIMNENTQPTHTIVTKVSEDIFDARTKRKVPKNHWLRLTMFLGQDKNDTIGFGWYPPFNYADFVIDAKRKDIFVLPVEKLRFYLIEWNEYLKEVKKLLNYDNRRILLMKKQLEYFRKKQINLNTLVNRLEAIFKAIYIQNQDSVWEKEFEKNLLDLESINAYLVDKKLKEIPYDRQKVIDEAILEIEKLINNLEKYIHFNSRIG